MPTHSASIGGMRNRWRRSRCRPAWPPLKPSQPPMPAGKRAACAGRAAAGRAPAAPAPSPPREWTGEYGSSGHPLMKAARDPPGGGKFPHLSGRPVAARRQARRLARDASTNTSRAHARPAHHGSGGRAAGVHQGVLGLSRHLVHDARIAARPRDARPAQGRSSTRSRRPMASTATSSPRSGASNPTTARSAATGR